MENRTVPKNALAFSYKAMFATYCVVALIEALRYIGSNDRYHFLLCLFAPAIPLAVIMIFRVLKLRFTWHLNLIILGFIMLAYMMGSCVDLYHSILGYDKFVHTVSGAFVSLLVCAAYYFIKPCHSMEVFADAWSGQVFVVNNRRISVTLYESVLEALHMAQQGMNAVAIKTSLEAHAADSSIYITVNTLEYLKRSGRVTPAGAAIAETLSLKPVLTIQGGKLDAYAKVRGMKNSQKRMIAATADDLARRFANFHLGQIRIGAAGTFENPDDAQRWTQQLAEAFPQYQVYYQPLSCSIACHVGIDAAGLGISCLQP